MNERRRGSKWRRWAIVLGVLALVVGIDYLAYPYGTAPRGGQLNTGDNGLWLRYPWYFGRKSEAELAALGPRLRNLQIRYAYFHVRSIRKDGRLEHRYRQAARKLTDRMKRDAPEVQAIAWIYAGNRRGLGQVELANPAVRATMVREAVWLVAECGFAGVQWDYEICEDGDPGFLRLMEETRAALPSGAVLSTAVPVSSPLHRWGYGWSAEYYAKVAATCDQIAVMGYDSGLYLPRAYAWLVARQAMDVTRAVARGNPRCRVLLGVPTYGRGGLSHHAHSENLEVALRGVRDGVSDSRTDRSVFAGVALFADYTTQPGEWATYRRLWLER